MGDPDGAAQALAERTVADSHFVAVAEVATDPARSLVYEHGWQSWSPAGLYRATDTSPRPRNEERQTMGYRPGKPAPESGFQGEGLLAVLRSDGPGRIWAPRDPGTEVPSIRLHVEAGRLVVSADGPVVERSFDGGLASALGSWADDLAVAELHSIPPGWCSWYCYWGEVTQDDVLANLAAADRLGLQIGVVQIDDGHQARVGDWLERSPRFGPLDRLADRIRATGRRAGIWSAPFLAAADSQLAREHPDWLVHGACAGRNWGAELHVLDVTHPEAAEHLEHVYRTLTRQGFDYHKLDFLFAAAMEGRSSRGRLRISPVLAACHFMTHFRGC